MECYGLRRAPFRRTGVTLTQGRPKDGLRAADPTQAREWLDDPSSAIRNYLHFLTAHDPRPLVLFVDEADGLVGETMVTLLTQMRDGYMARRDVPFPSSVALVGMRTVRDFFLTKEQQNVVAWLGTSSPFNVSAESTTLAPFTEADTAELLAQHTKATGHRFEPEAITKVWELAEGHPWLTNALADQAVSNDVRDRAGLRVGALHDFDAAQPGLWPRSLNRWILPVAVLGSSFTNSTQRGYL